MYSFVKFALEKMRTEHMWIRRMTYSICVQCPICSKDGVRTSECDIHHIDGRTRDQCLHYFTEDELLKSKDALMCYESDDPTNTVIPRENFTPWFEALDSEVRASLVLIILISMTFI